MTINSKQDYNASTPEQQAQFKQLLSGSIYRLEKDDTAGCWKAIEDTRTIESFGFSRVDFPDATMPELPVYIAPPPKTPEYVTQRIAAYPPATDYLDGIVKGDQAQVQAYIDACLAVKAKYPKGVI